MNILPIIIVSIIGGCLGAYKGNRREALKVGLATMVLLCALLMFLSIVLQEWEYKTTPITIDQMVIYDNSLTVRCGDAIYEDTLRVSYTGSSYIKEATPIVRKWQIIVPDSMIYIYISPEDIIKFTAITPAQQ